MMMRLILAETELDRLDILIENAGIATRAFRRTSDGWEQTYSISNLESNLVFKRMSSVLSSWQFSFSP